VKPRHPALLTRMPPRDATISQTWRGACDGCSAGPSADLTRKIDTQPPRLTRQRHRDDHVKAREIEGIAAGRSRRSGWRRSTTRQKSLRRSRIANRERGIQTCRASHSPDAEGDGGRDHGSSRSFNGPPAMRPVFAGAPGVAACDLRALLLFGIRPGRKCGMTATILGEIDDALQAIGYAHPTTE
jgi:hypothetical protein